MTSLAFHPDDLLDRSRRGVPLSAAERDVLRAHLLVCSVCRFVQQAARDFDEEVPREDAGIGIRSYLSDAMVGYSPESRKAVPVGARRAWRARSTRFRGVTIAAGIVLLTGIAAAAQWVTGFPRLTRYGMRATSKAEAVSATKGHRRDRITRDVGEGATPRGAPASARGDRDVGARALGVDATAGGDEARPIAKGERAIVVAPEPPVAAERVGPTAPSEAVAIPRAPHSQPAAAIQTRPLPKARSRRIAQVVHAPTPMAVLTAADLFVQANTARRSGDADRALDLYERVLSEQGGSAEAQTSRAIVGRLLLDRHAPQAALRKFDEYLALGIGDLSEEVMIGRAEALAQLNLLEQERASWTALLRMFPHSAYAGQARSRIQVLTNLLPH